MRQALEKYFLKHWYSNTPIWWLRPLSWLFNKISTSKRESFLSGKKQSYKSPVPVIIVGNVTVGGTGKTPVVIFLIEQLKAKGFKPAVISRGYGANVETNRLVDSESDFNAVGDEPLLIFQRTKVPVAVGRNRKTSIELLLKNHPDVDVIISDDGLQHYALQRDYEIVIIDAERGIGNGAFLPAGPLRESEERLNSVDKVLTNGRSAMNMSASSMAFGLGGRTLVNLVTNERKTLSEFSHREVHAFAGIGNPQRFFSVLKNNRLKVQEHFVGDHAVMSDTFFARHQDKPILMTEKDAVKLRHLKYENIWYLPVDVQMPEDDKLKLVDSIVAKIKLKGKG